MKNSTYVNPKHIKSQKRKYQIIVKKHVWFSCVILIALAFFIFLSCGYQHPDKWKKTTITLDHYQTVRFNKGGTRLDIYDPDGNCYSINRSEGAIKKQLVVGRQYTFIYSDNFFHDIVEEMKIDGVEYLTHEDAISNYKGTKTILWVFEGLLLIALFVANYIVYHTSTKRLIKIYCTYKKGRTNKKQK